MAAQSSREQTVRKGFADALADIGRPTPLQNWLLNVKIPRPDSDGGVK